MSNVVLDKAFSAKSMDDLEVVEDLGQDETIR